LVRSDINAGLLLLEGLKQTWTGKLTWCS